MNPTLHSQLNPTMIPLPTEPQDVKTAMTPEKSLLVETMSEMSLDDPTADDSLSTRSDRSLRRPETPPPADEQDEQVAVEQSTPGKKVVFSTLEIREYPIIPGDNPSVTVGCPITIDWAHDDLVTCHVEEYEGARPKPRTMIELRIPSQLREEMLKRQGYSRQDILAGTKKANLTKNARRRTQETMKLAPLQEFLEKAKRGTMNATLNRSGKKKEREMLNAHRVGSESDAISV
eukprot:Nitzschia sp. Nitz4//scaffold76_size158648//95115//95813//NITZ4_002555-RA/size158648-processed-gene-0.244-mRNA-1//1//CDS//3329557872//5049//frame0